MAKTNQYGEVIASGKLKNDVPFEIATADNPFGEAYLVVTVKGIMVCGLIIGKKKTGTIECRNKVMGIVRVTKEGQLEEKDHAPQEPAELE